MISMDSLLNMVCTEAIEKYTSIEEQERLAKEANLLPIKYSLELVENKDGRLYWVE